MSSRINPGLAVLATMTGSAALTLRKDNDIGLFASLRQEQAEKEQPHRFPSHCSDAQGVMGFQNRGCRCVPA